MDVAITGEVSGGRKQGVSTMQEQPVTQEMSWKNVHLKKGN